MIQLLAKVTAVAGERDELERILLPLHVAAGDEPGTLVFRMFQDLADPDVLWFYEEYVDERAQRLHTTSDTFREVGRGVRDLLAAPLQMIPVEERNAHA